MTTTIMVCCFIGLAFLVFVLAPFWLGPGGMLVPSALLHDKDEVKRLQGIVLRRYLQDEAANRQGELSKAEWGKRQQFLTNRYLDLSRRYDFLAQLGERHD